MKKPTRVCVYIVCMYFYRQNNIPNFLNFPSAKYEETKQARARITEGLVSSFMLISHTTLLIKTLLSRTRGLVLPADIFLSENATAQNQLSLHPQKLYFNQTFIGKFFQF